MGKIKFQYFFRYVARALHNWMSLGSNLYLGIGTTLKYYIKEGAVYSDVTPIRATTTNGITFSATDGSSTITATDSNHGAVRLTTLLLYLVPFL